MTDARPSRGARVGQAVRNGILVLIVLMTVGMVAMVASGRYQVRPVLSGSMRPGLPVGGVVVTKRVPVSSLKVRDVIVFHRPDIPDELVVHRIVSLRQVAGGGVVIQTQGDNNPVKDPWKVTLKGATAYQAVFSVPLLGYVSVWWHQPLTRVIALLLAAGCAVGAAVSLLWSRRSSEVDPPTPKDHSAPDDAPASQTQHEAEVGV